jgi:hypothetical protein
LCLTDALEGIRRLVTVSSIRLFAALRLLVLERAGWLVTKRREGA